MTVEHPNDDRATVSPSDLPVVDFDHARVAPVGVRHTDVLGLGEPVRYSRTDARYLAIGAAFVLVLIALVVVIIAAGVSAG